LTNFDFFTTLDFLSSVDCTVFEILYEDLQASITVSLLATVPPFNAPFLGPILMETPDFFAIFETFDRAANSDAYAMSQNFQFLSSEDIFENTQFTDLTPSTAILESVPNLPEFALNTNDNVTAIYHYSIPTSKLAYPEPFIASASFMHTDL
jgi:hypothetical protein